MMGHHTRSESLFYYFRLEDQVPVNHLLRLINEHINVSFVFDQLKDSYSDTGRPWLDPEQLLRIVLIGYLYGISCGRKLVEELRMHLAWPWFTGLGFDQEIPHHSTFSKNRHGRFQESKLSEQMFERIVAQFRSRPGARRQAIDLLLIRTSTPHGQPPVSWSQMADALRAVPGVKDVAIAGWPMLSGGRAGSISVNAAPPTDTWGYFLSISPGWLNTMQMRLIDGRGFDPWKKSYRRGRWLAWSTDADPDRPAGQGSHRPGT